VCWSHSLQDDNLTGLTAARSKRHRILATEVTNADIIVITAWSNGAGFPNIFIDCVYGWISHFPTAKNKSMNPRVFSTGLSTTTAWSISMEQHCIIKRRGRSPVRWYIVRWVSILLSHDFGLIRTFYQSSLLSWYFIPQP